ncbi:MAG TPA: NADH-quinone oxidoreductase subunit C [Sulfurovum sp.]|nr:NADH-quinone oxidoreductase subunit C [Sulfurovum sp.]
MKIKEIIQPIQENLQYPYKLKEDNDNYGNKILWLKLDNKKDITNVARVIANLGGRCVTITVYKANDIHFLIYHLDVDGILINVEAHTTDNTIDSITPLLPSANWAEREFREMYAIEPIGHPCNERLFLDESITKGVLNQYIPLSKMMLGINENDILWERVEKENKI